jgi:hypothetical protein
MAANAGAAAPMFDMLDRVASHESDGSVLGARP